MRDYRDLPREYWPMSPWGYIGHSILYSIPLIGWIILIIHACDSGYIARRNYARSFFIPLILAIIAAVILIILSTLGYIVVSR